MPCHAAPPFDLWSWTQACRDTWWAGLDPGGIGQRLRQQRLAALLSVAARDSPLYRRRSPQAQALADFEPVTKAELMRRFDDWATDRRITREGVEAFLARPDVVADAWLGRYMVWTSSGTSGEPGIFVQDAASLAAYDAIDALRLRGPGLGPVASSLWGLGRRFAYVGATGGHFAGLASIERLRRLMPAIAPEVHVLSVLRPLPQLAAELQALQPSVLITYPSCAAALAALQAGGALQLRLAEVWLGGEQLSPARRGAVQAAFACPVRNNYGASEFYAMAFECPAGRLHLNADWLILEALDRRLRPVAPGETADTVLLTNLANRTQPLLRYVLGDRVTYCAAPCRCGSGLPAIAVQGRADDTLTLPGRGGGQVTILPLALETVIEEQAQVTQFQLTQCRTDTARARLEIRLEPSVPDAAAAFERCRRVIVEFLHAHGAAATTIGFNRQAPTQGWRSGKRRRIVGIGGDIGGGLHGDISGDDMPACGP